MLAALAAATIARPGAAAAKLDVRCQGTELVATLVPDPAQPVDRVDWTIDGFKDYAYTDYDPPFEVRLVPEGQPKTFRMRVAFFYQGTRLGSLASAQLKRCGYVKLATLTSKCIGTSNYVKVTPASGVNVSRVVFRGAGPSVDTRPPFQAWTGPLSLVGDPGYPPRVVAQVYSSAGTSEELVSTGKRCPSVIRRQPPLVSTIVEGTSLGGVSIGALWPQVEAVWGTPNTGRACHGGVRVGDFVCDWDTRGGRMGPITVSFARSAEGMAVESVSVHTEGARRPKYRRWKTATGVGVGSPIAQLQRAYGGQLRRARVSGTYYVVSRRNATVFTAEQRRIGRIAIMSLAAFRKQGF